MKYFAVSDTHGFTTQFRRAVRESGFERGNPDHMLVHLGDCFDRGYENAEMLDYLDTIKNKIMIRGNHEDLLLNIFDSGRIGLRDLHNGTNITVAQFFGQESIDPEGKVSTAADPGTERRIRGFIAGMRDYYETANYIFVHGWVPLDTGSDAASAVLPDWRCAGENEWKTARFLEWQQTYAKGLTLPDKTVVCGHRPATFGYYFDPSRAPDDPSAFYGKGVIAIDATTARSGKVNLIVIEDDPA